VLAVAAPAESLLEPETALVARPIVALLLVVLVAKDFIPEVLVLAHALRKHTVRIHKVVHLFIVKAMDLPEAAVEDLVVAVDLPT
jgi:hypothetical protein